MQQQKTMPCVYCQVEAILKEENMIVKKGLVKIEAPAHYYECTSCKRTFKTNDQDKATSAAIHPHRAKMHQEPDRGTRKRR